MFRMISSAALLAAALVVAGPARAAQENYVFSASWEPTFCETHGSKPECQTESPDRFDATHLALHGLWPQAQSYCGVNSTDQYDDKSGQWSLLPAVVLDPATSSLLQTDMPGTMSYLERHEWIKHGTCSGYSQQDYFATALSMLGGVQGGNLQAEITADIGYEVPLSNLQAAARQDYGTAADQGIEYLCSWIGGYAYLSEVRFHLALPWPLPAQVQPQYLVPPTQPASSSQLCPANVVIDWVQ